MEENKDCHLKFFCIYDANSSLYSGMIFLYLSMHSLYHVDDNYCCSNIFCSEVSWKYSLVQILFHEQWYRGFCSKQLHWYFFHFLVKLEGGF